MAVTVNAPKPNALLSAIKQAIDERKIQTWTYDSDGDFTHSAQQWNREAWFRPSVAQGALIFNIIPPQGKSVSTEIYGIYHGRFIEMLLVHFDEQLSNADATAMPTLADVVNA
jgi:hypothetical protein